MLNCHICSMTSHKVLRDNDIVTATFNIDFVMLYWVGSSQIVKHFTSKDILTNYAVYFPLRIDCQTVAVESMIMSRL